MFSVSGSLVIVFTPDSMRVTSPVSLALAGALSLQVAMSSTYKVSA